nr:methylcobalamin: coenzyme M methyltransferase isoenzyme II {N-terminal} [Methanosarcina barkeri, methanol-grown cells, Peptide Partial, 18 aa] [Methanosarcina barkeri]
AEFTLKTLLAALEGKPVD